MANYGRVLFECLDCKRKWFPRRSEWGRASGISCPDCGSRMWMESAESREMHKLAKPGYLADHPGQSQAARRSANREERR